MTPDDARHILWRLDAMEKAQREYRDETKEQLGRIEKHAATTNGRVTKLELWRARIGGFIAAASLLGPAITGIVVWVLTH